MPSYQELGEMLQITKKGAYNSAMKLVEQGVLGKDEKGKLLPLTLFNIPVVGSIKAGYPSQAMEGSDESLNVFEFVQETTGDVMCLKVSGDSMKDAAIVEGDYVLVNKRKTPRIGEIVCALIDGEWTLKYYQVINGRVALVPANDKYPVIYPDNELMIGGGFGGVVTMVVRKPGL